jgi:hypothetical protein
MLKSERLISVKYPTRCRTCSSKVSFGDKAIWQPGYGITRCLKCIPSGALSKLFGPLTSKEVADSDNYHAYWDSYSGYEEDESFVLPDLEDR